MIRSSRRCVRKSPLRRSRVPLPKLTRYGSSSKRSGLTMTFGRDRAMSTIAATRLTDCERSECLTSAVRCAGCRSGEKSTAATLVRSRMVSTARRRTSWSPASRSQCVPVHTSHDFHATQYRRSVPCVRSSLSAFPRSVNGIPSPADAIGFGSSGTASTASEADASATSASRSARVAPPAR